MADQQLAVAQQFFNNRIESRIDRLLIHFGALDRNGIYAHEVNELRLYRGINFHRLSPHALDIVLGHIQHCQFIIDFLQAQ